MPEKPLENITVIDCSQIIAGPIAAMYMADFGAEVIKIEHPDYGDSVRNFGAEGRELAWKWLGRNKRSVGLDLSIDEGAAVFEELIADADVLVEGFRPGTMERWGLGWADLSEINPELVMVRISGFGQTGKYRDRPGFGTLAEAMSGFAAVTGFSDKPPTLPSLGLADAIAGCYATFATMFALYHRDVGGASGQYVDTSLLEPLFSTMGRLIADYSVTDESHTRTGNRSSFTVPRNTYRTEDNRWVAISASAETIAKRILRIVGGEELASDPRFETSEKRLEHADLLDGIVAEWIAERPREEVIAEFEQNEAAIAPVYDTADIFEDEYFRERDGLVEVDDPDIDTLVLPGVFPKLSETPGKIEHPGRPLGADTIPVLAKRTHLTEPEIRDLERRGVVAVDD